MTPFKNDKISTGPYTITEFKSRTKLVLTRSPFYLGQPQNQYTQKVEAAIIPDDETALRLFETGNLNLLRRLPTAQFDHYRNHKGFLQIPVARFDYIGFGPELKNEKNLRIALSHSLDFVELEKLYQALGRPGCPSLPRNYLSSQPCIEFDLKKAKEAFAKVPEAIQSKRLKLFYSQQGGDDIAKGMEWMQNQWKKNLGFNVELNSMEQVMYLSKLRTDPPAIFRKGVTVDRPTCLAALELFSKIHPENFIRFESKPFEDLLFQMGRTKAKPAQKTLCSTGSEMLLNEYSIIPLGEIHFTMLHDRKFTGWELNELNQLDLTELKLAK